MRCAKCGSETPIGHRCIVDDLEAIRKVDLSDHPLFKREAVTAPEPREDVRIGGADVSVSFPDERDTAVAEVLAKLLHDHRALHLLPPLLVSGCTCGWGSEVFAHTAHVAEVLAPLIAEPVREVVERARDESAVAEVGLTDAEWTRLRHAAGNRGDLGPIAEEVERILGERVRAAEVEAWDEGYSDGLDYMSLPGSVRQVEPENPYRADRRHAQDNPGPAQAPDSRRETER